MTSMSFTYHVDTGDDVKVSLDTGDGIRLSPDQDASFSVKQDGQVLLSGKFVHFNAYFDYVLSIEGLEVFEITPEDDFPSFYFFEWYGENGEEYTFFDQVEDSDVGVVLSAVGISAEEAEEAFRHLHFETVQ